MNNIYDNPITIGGDALLWLLHQVLVAAWVETDSAPSGALDLDMGAIKVGGVDEGAGREYVSEEMLLGEKPPPANEGNQGVWLPHEQALGSGPADHVRPGNWQKLFKGNPTLRGGNTTWGRQPDQRPSPQAGSCKKFSHTAMQVF